MEELRFGSEEEALQYLADISGSKVKIAGESIDVGDGTINLDVDKGNISISSDGLETEPAKITISLMDGATLEQKGDTLKDIHMTNDDGEENTLYEAVVSPYVLPDLFWVSDEEYNMQDVIDRRWYNELYMESFKKVDDQTYTFELFVR